MGAGPIKAYHGSPHDFERFDLSKIGTGEGAQAYGHGLYFAENPKVAEEYRRALAGGSDKLIGGNPYNSADPEHLAASLANTFSKSGDGRKTALAELT
jgi:ADP-Ribosyltransferase in polyvalent proteins